MKSDEERIIEIIVIVVVIILFAVIIFFNHKHTISNRTLEPATSSGQPDCQQTNDEGTILCE